MNGFPLSYQEQGKAAHYHFYSKLYWLFQPLQYEKIIRDKKSEKKIYLHVEMTGFLNIEKPKESMKQLLELISECSKISTLKITKFV